MASTKGGRTSENEIAVAALRIAAEHPGGESTTEVLKDNMPDYIELSPGDLEASPTRLGEQMFHQIVGNIVSHRDSQGNIIFEGYAEYTGSGIRITEAGRAHLRSKGYDA